MPGIKFARGDLILAGALVIDTVMEAGGFGMVEATDAGLREGVFFESLLGDPPLVDDVRHATVRNLAAQYDTDFAHAEHVARLSLELWDGLAAAGVHRGDPKERELLWATAMLHDIGIGDRLRRPPQALALPDPQRRPAGLQPARDGPDRPGRALSPQGQPRASASSPRSRATATRRCSTASRPPSGSPSSSSAHATRPSTPATCRSPTARSSCGCVASEDVTIARWATERQGDVFRKAFGRELTGVS